MMFRQCIQAQKFVFGITEVPRSDIVEGKVRQGKRGFV